MTKKIKDYDERNLHQCEVCTHLYEDLKYAAACEEYCKENDQTNKEITRHAIKQIKE